MSSMYSKNKTICLGTSVPSEGSVFTFMTKMWHLRKHSFVWSTFFSESCSCQHHSSCQSSLLKLCRSSWRGIWALCTQRFNDAWFPFPPLAQSASCMPGSPPNLDCAALLCFAQGDRRPVGVWLVQASVCGEPVSPCWTDMDTFPEVRHRVIVCDHECVRCILATGASQSWQHTVIKLLRLEIGAVQRCVFQTHAMHSF